MPDPILIPVEHNPWADLPKGPTELRQGPMGVSGWLPFVGEAIKQHFTNKLQSTVNAVATPGDVMMGRLDPESPEGFARVQELAHLGFTGGMPLAPRGAAGIFGGRLSATADVPAFGEAQAMSKAGSGPEAIFNRTGWFQGADQKWRYEIPDTTAQMTGALGVPTSLAIAHPALFKAYPQLRNIRTDLIPGSREEGSFTPHWSNSSTPGDIGLSASAAMTPSVMLHELQHAVQGIEGFQPGASPDQDILGHITQARMMNMLHHAENLQKMSLAGIPGYGTPQDLARKISGRYSPSESDKILDMIVNNHPDQLAAWKDYYKEHIPENNFVAYERTAGETEARNVSTRYGLGQNVPPGQMINYPWATEDVPRHQQIVKSGPQWQLLQVPYDPFGAPK